MVDRGWGVEEIENAIMEYYQRSADRSPWDFLKAEYRRGGKLSNYKSAIEARKKAGGLYR